MATLVSAPNGSYTMSDPILNIVPGAISGPVILAVGGPGPCATPITLNFTVV